MLPLSGVDVVLDVHWLKSLGPILTDYNTLKMKFVHHGTIIELHSDTNRDLEAISSPQLRRMVQTDAISDFFHIRLCSPTPPSSTIPPEIQPLLHQFATLLMRT